MPNIAVVLKQEIARLARREIRGEITTLKKASAQYRRDIAALKRRTVKLERQVGVLGGKVLDVPRPAASGNGEAQFRFVAKGLRSLRKRLGVSANDFASLVGVSAQSVYNWELGKAKPRGTQLATLAALRGMGKREAVARLEQLTAKKPTKRSRA